MEAAWYRVANGWSEREVEGMDALGRLVFRSHLLGRDRAVCNWKGGNTSTKGVVADFRGRETRVMWIKGSGSDLLTIPREGFTCLALEPVGDLLEREAMTDEEMVAYLRHCMLEPDQPRPSIETLMHAFLPFPCVDHTHPDSIVTLCNARNGRELAREAFGETVAWIPYVRPGFTLAKQVALAVRENPGLRAVLLAKHGLVTWGATDRETYESTLALINDAAQFLGERAGERPPYGGVRVQAWPAERRRSAAAELLPVVRGAVSRRQRAVVVFDDSEDVLELVGSRDGRGLALTGSACPDHLVHTKHRPLWVDVDPSAGSLEPLKEAIRTGVEAYAEQYRAYVQAHRSAGDPEGDPYPRIVLVPGIGMFATGKDAETARNAAGLYHRAVAVMRALSSVDAFESLTDAEAYAVEYWPLELYKLTLAPPEKELARRVALVTGAASGIGRQAAVLMASQGAHVVLADINAAGAQEAAGEINGRWPGRALAVAMDVTEESSVRDGFRQAVLAYGGLDVLVSNAGIAISKPLEQTEPHEWQRLFDVLVKGYYLVSREAVRIMKEQGIGGSIVFVTSKNALVASRGAAGYNAAKAAEAHLARSLAEELGPHGIRVNSVAPDAVLEGSSIWSSEWRNERAQAYGIDASELEAYYRGRTTLRVNVRPDDVAEAILFLASDRASRTTGCTVTVDGGVAAAFTR
ncbi:bifunctional rhamnulose-1-phosphate aldolase/short-chain dehydrogenase [Limnochorda pilosa]|uniref:Short-chain dehydrogenase n=1 Tax=Limnochorda pilosa TaxID=1555112 RepID=A0A0K2SH44_LIMPI|nr:bifunctional rhamnulose-1-phosphate aldolase/short-chain dehydrogenase [Limnochorda pilosa]BAS26410.1 short-chain dehydrogenase [Limnochorda pilosa]